MMLALVLMVMLVRLQTLFVSNTIEQRSVVAL